MRKHQKDKIIELIGTVGEANEEVKGLLSHGNIAVAVQLLSDIYAFSENIEEFVTSVSNDCVQTTRALGEFKSVLEQVIKTLTFANDSNRSLNSISKLINKVLVKITNAVEFELAIDKIEVIFLGSRPSTSDSLESVYLAAVADPSCEAYFIPVESFEPLSDTIEQIRKRYRESFGVNAENVKFTSFSEYNI